MHEDQLRDGKKIEACGNFSVRPKEMAFDTERMIYHIQYDLDYKVKARGGREKAAVKLKLNLYFDPTHRSEGQKETDREVAGQQAALKAIMDSKEPAPDTDTLKREYRFLDVVVDEKDKTIASFRLNEKKYEDSLKLCGFMALVTLGLDFSAPEAICHYGLRDEQEKCFQMTKSEMDSDRQRNWSEDGKTGRLFVLFVGLIIGSYIRHVWKTTPLKKMFNSSLAILDEMRSIRYIEREGHAPSITPFVGKQVDIARAFNFDIPSGCEPGYKSKKVGRKRGRPRKDEAK